MPFADTHVHLHFPDYDNDRADILKRARAAGVELFINVGTDALSSKQALLIAEAEPGIYATAGIHPHDAAQGDDAAFAAITQLLEHPKMVAIGEVGLDFFRDHSPRDKQKEVLRKFIALHKKTKKPLVLHCRDAYEDLISLLKEEMNPPYHGVIHCFSSDKPMMTKLVDLGFYISFAGPLTYKKNDVLREACRACPADRLLLETDAPFLPPQSMRGKRNESSFLLETAQVAAGLHQMTPERLGEETLRNAKKAFSL